MLRKLYLSITTFLVLGGAVVAQKGAIKITITDSKTKEALAFGNVVVLQGSTQVGTGTTDLDGNVIIKPLEPGKYNVKAVYVGYQAKETQGVIVSADKTTYVPMALSNEDGVRLDEVVITSYTEPLIDPDTKSGGTVTREEYQNMATKNILSVASTTAGVYQQDEGSSVNVRGGRSENTNVFIDGERAIGTTGIPQQGVEQVSVILGGLPAQYGDATSGVISITTRGPQPKFFGGVEAISSQITDKFGYNFLGFSVGGPIYSKKDSAGNVRPILGFFLAGEIFNEKDPDPSAVGVWKVKDDKLAEIETNPLKLNEQGNYLRSAEYITFDDMEKVKVRQNVARLSYRISPKIDFKPTTNLNFTLGGTWDWNRRHDFINTYALFNPANNPQTTEQTWRTYFRVTQKFGRDNPGGADKTQSLIKNAYFTFQIGYQKYKSVTEDDTHKDQIFRYGHVGNFKTYQTDYFEAKDTSETTDVIYDTNGDGVLDTVKYNSSTGYTVNEFLATLDTSLSYAAGPYNPLASNYVTQYYNEQGQPVIASAAETGLPYDIVSYFELLGNNSLFNGYRPGNVHSLWLGQGRQYNGYSVTDNSIFRITSSFSADIKNHAIMIGIEYDQRDSRGYNVNDASGVWNRMRQLANLHLSTRDLNSPIFNTVVNAPGDTDLFISYAPQYGSQSHFSKVMYEKTGLSSSQFLDVDNYDPDFYSMDMLTPDEILNEGNGSLVDAWGYDYYGNRIKDKNVTFEDYVNKFSLSRGDTVYDRLVGAFKPIYMSGYIQDKFDFKDIKFNIGVRIDRYDANQKTLKDKYLFKPAYTKSEAASQGAQGLNQAQGVSEDAIVYVDNFESSAPNVVGYRDGDTWYDVNGNVVNDPKLISDQTTTGTISPFLKRDDPFLSTKYNYSNNAFEDYKPQVRVMPRIAFSFPISDVANFFAHYDVLTQRPTGGSRLDPKDYAFISSIVAGQGVIANPNLKPEKTIDYELGFNQILNEKKSAALKLSAFYRELRDMIQIMKINQAYPFSYLTYSNLDFGTVKGFSIEFDMRRTGGFSLNANYTLQFAEGSGSSATGGYSLANSSQPNLRVTQPLNFDQRHTLTTTLDYRFGSGKDYHGPSYTSKKGDGEKVHQILKDVGANMVLRLGSGTPYTRQQQSLSDVLLGVNQNPTIAGSLNGSYLPWQFRADLRIDKNFELTFGKSKPEEDRKSANLNVYVQVLNILNTKNIIAVHAFTGTPDDDGYLNSPNSQAYQNSVLAFGQDYYNSFRDLYSARLLDPGYYSRPRVIRLGVQFDF